MSDQSKYKADHKFINKSNINKNFTILHNAVINDASLTWEARGVLVYLLSKPADWVVKKHDLINQSPAGEHVIARVLKELEEANYLERNRSHNKKGHWVWHTYVYDKPTIPQKTTDGLATDGSTTDGLATDGKLGNILSTESQSTESQSTESQSTEEEEGDFPFETKTKKTQTSSAAADISQGQELLEKIVGVITSNGMQHIEIVNTLIDKVGREQAANTMREAFDAWKKSTTKNGRKYSTTNFGWIEWAVEYALYDVTPEVRKNGHIEKTNKTNENKSKPSDFSEKQLQKLKNAKEQRRQ